MSQLVHPTALIASDLNLPSRVSIGAYTRVESGVNIGEGATIGDFCHLGGGPETGVGELSIGAGSIIRSHSVIYAGSSFGERLETGHHVVIRERTFAGTNLRIGNFSDIEGDCTIGDFCRFHGYVHIGKGSKVGHFVWLFSLVTATNDPLPPSFLARPVEIGDGAVVCVGALLMPGTELGAGAFVTAGSKAQGKIAIGAVVTGNSGSIVSHVANLIDIDSGLRHPWMRHLRDRYPANCHDRLNELMDKILKNRFSLVLTNDHFNDSAAN